MPKDEWDYPTEPVIDNPMIDPRRQPNDPPEEVEDDERDDDDCDKR